MAKTKKLEVTKELAVKLCKEDLGIKTASRWGVSRLLGKLTKLNEIEEEPKFCCDETKELFKSCLKAIKSGSEVVITDEGTEETQTAPAKSEKKGKGKKGKKAAASTEVIEPEETPAEDAKAKKGKKKAGKDKKKDKEKKKPGIIKMIATILNEHTSKKNAIPKDDILKQLKKAFPDRREEALLSTISTQVPNRLRKEKGMNIEKCKDGYYVAKSKK